LKIIITFGQAQKSYANGWAFSLFAFLTSRWLALFLEKLFDIPSISFLSGMMYISQKTTQLLFVVIETIKFTNQWI
jgi:hypothetical protein